MIARLQIFKRFRGTTRSHTTSTARGNVVKGAFGDAIADRVNIISKSAGPFLEGGLQLLTLVFNSWLPKTIDRKFVSQVVLGNGQIFTGTAINNFVLNGTSYPLIWGGDGANVSASAKPDFARFCLPGNLNSLKEENRSCNG
ncbi:hypothetical protein IFM89_023717 [Coptis chinensis]|uniref:Uncharacterized protein n=1 Tax=Coptis chinensis TaxID=261450 RepID=A0A835LSM0_9MAGN|nr:hypothetical protein IFM89_023717 [Coptis chinensis]